MIWIDEVEIFGFGPFPSLKTRFHPGLNFVVGENESGKTSLHSAILGILFGIRHSNLYRREGATEFRGRLLLRQGNDQLEIQRSFSDDYVVVTRLGSKELSFSGRATFMGRSQERLAYDQILKDWFGIDDQSLFRSSVFVEQQALQIEPDREAGQQLSRLITGSEELPYEEIGA
ncbi:MAG TPA: ATP-binding protein, partial [Bdellovibrionota bacterium]|nr:ATP-binding protein [Bdellovibrionota bacterium]